jgi:hypothetical protein
MHVWSKFPFEKGSAIRHCRRLGCDPAKLQTIELFKLRCGRYVSQSQVTKLFEDRDYLASQSNSIIVMQEPLFCPSCLNLKNRPYLHSHVHPSISGCGGSQKFIEKIKTDFVMIHSAPNPSIQLLLINIHKHAENWLLNFAQKNILMVPGNLRASLQTFEGGGGRDITSLVPTLCNMIQQVSFQN